MEQLFNDLRQQIAGTMGDTVSLIDEDYGQLDALKNGGEQYPVTFPCILLSPLETAWSNQKDNWQHGHCTLSVRLAFDCHSDAPQAQHASERMPARLAVRRMQLGTDTPHQQALCPARRDKGIRNGVLHERGRAVFRIATTGVPVRPAGISRAGRHWR